jgi:hypothetical protein
MKYYRALIAAALSVAPITIAQATGETRFLKAGSAEFGPEVIKVTEE